MLFTNAGFLPIDTAEKAIALHGVKSELDTLFIYENILITVEYTARKQNLSDHLRKKAEFSKQIQGHTREFVDALRGKFPSFDQYCLERQFRTAEYRVRYLYASHSAVSDEHKDLYASALLFLDYPDLMYFYALVRTIHKSARYELFKFCGLELKDIGHQTSGQVSASYDGVLLPEAPSGFPEGHKLCSFLVDPGTLLERAYVLRREGWRQRDCLYQRLLSKPKIADMRRYLAKEHRVFVNNIIATLPPDTELRNKSNQSLDPIQANQMERVRVVLPQRLGTIGIVDGQHRLFCYHEGDDAFEKDIVQLRKQQHLLVTGIIYPQGITEEERTRFEAKLFLEINDKQKRVQSDLKHVIETMVDPFSPTAISRAILMKLSGSGPLKGYLQEHFYDTKQIKTASIVSYGLRHVVRTDTEATLYNLWKDDRKVSLADKKDLTALSEYVDFCAQQINNLLIAFKEAVGGEMWVLDKKASRVLTTTTVNGLIFCLRKLLAEGKTGGKSHYRSKLKKIKVDFSPPRFKYKSSHWKALGEEIFNQCFA